jgi:hypothetical protein
VFLEEIRDFGVTDDFVLELEDVVSFVFEDQQLDIHVVGLEQFSDFS